MAASGGGLRDGGRGVFPRVGFVIIQETMAIEKMLCYTPRSQRKGATPNHALGGRYKFRHQGGSRGRGSEEKMQARAFIVVSMGGDGQGRVSRLRIGQFESFQRDGSGALVLSGVAWYLAPG